MKIRKSNLFGFLILSIFFVVTMAFLCMLGTRIDSGNVSAIPKNTPTVIIDAGHGGEDGGASSQSGLAEKDLNLAIAKNIGSYLEQSGFPVVYTRTEDILLYDRNVDFKGRKKMLDLAARLKIARSYENAVFVSIHMNAFPQKQYSGLQVYYSPHHPLSETLANKIQKNTARHLDNKNQRSTKPAGSSIYLLDRQSSPAILVECGFLSNDAEAEKLSSEEYRKQLSLVIAESIASVISDQP